MKYLRDQEELYFINAARKRWFIISIGNTYNFYWRLLIIILAVYNAIALPMQAAFVEVTDLYSENEFLKI